MKKLKSALLISGSVLAIGALALSMQLSTRSKKQTLGEVRGHDLHKHGKAAGSLLVSISAPDGSISRAGERLNLVATVESTSNLSGLRYVWLLPQGVTIDRGSLEGTIGTLNDGEAATIPLSIVSNSNENKQIDLRVYRMQNGESVGHVAQYNTVTQMEIDQALQTKAEILSERGPASEQFKIMQ